MTLLLGIVIGAGLYYLIDRGLMRIARAKLSRDDQIRRAFLDRMGYDSLVTFQKAVDAEMARRRPGD